MATLESLGKVVSADVLIIGGGFAGLTAAIAAKEATPYADVLVVDKATCGWGGKANKGHGNISYVDPEDGYDSFIDFHLRNQGCFLEDQDLLRAYVVESHPNLERLESWGVRLARQEDGSLKWIRSTNAGPLRRVGMDLDMMPVMLTHATRQEVRFIDKVAVIDLLKDGERVVGAIGFSILDGTPYIVKARATVIANGSQNFQIMMMWASGRGDGIAAAYRAGAEMRNAEFGSFIHWIFADTKHVCEGVEDVLYDSKGRPVTEKIRFVRAASIHSADVVAWWKEMKAGNGPYYARMRDSHVGPGSQSGAVSARPYNDTFWANLAKKEEVGGKRPGPMREVMPGFIGELSPIKVGHDMATTLPGLFAIGDASCNGSAWAGAVPCPPGRMGGTGLGNALFSGIRGGSAAGRYAATASEPDVNPDQAEELKVRMFAPLGPGDGVAPGDIVRGIQQVIAPIHYSIYKQQARMVEALGKILDLKARLPETRAHDWHYLAGCHEAAATVLSAEMFYRASIARRESRGWHIREDYPETDNENWLKWIALRESKGEMVLATEDIPIERYPVKP